MKRSFLPVMVAAFVAAAGPATAHAIIVEAKPDVGATVVGTNLPIDLRFNSKIDHARSRVWLTGPQQITVTIAKDAAVDRLIGQVGMIAPGDYVLHWQVLAVDGHITRGDIPFSVAAP